ncbi:MAG: helix-turn-helix domain-containing protein [Acidobacteriia bacterium]|nr:helix-turn-helix domain-containing protein [Terriglobia bacterium]
MSAGRPPEGPKHADHLDGDNETKRRLRVVLETLSGERSVESACEELGVSPSRFHELRREALQAALDGLAPGASGRPKRKGPEGDSQRLEALERENEDLRFELQAAFVRTEIALAMPHVLTRKARADIKKKARQARRRLRQGSGEPGSGT